MAKPFDYLKTCKDRKDVVDAEVAAFVESHPELTHSQIAKLFGCSAATISTIASEHGCRRKRGPRAGEVERG